MEWENGDRVAAIVGAVVVMVALLVASVMSGVEVDAAEIIGLVIGTAATFLTGLAAGAGKVKS